MVDWSSFSISHFSFLIFLIGVTSCCFVDRLPLTEIESMTTDFCLPLLCTASVLESAGIVNDVLSKEGFSLC